MIGNFFLSRFFCIMLVATFILAYTAVILLVCIITNMEDDDRVLYSFPFGDFPHMRIIPLINNSEKNHSVLLRHFSLHHGLQEFLSSLEGAPYLTPTPLSSLSSESCRCLDEEDEDGEDLGMGESLLLRFEERSKAWSSL